jgi:hypothetical protein
MMIAYKAVYDFQVMKAYKVYNNVQLMIVLRNYYVKLPNIELWSALLAIRVK